MIYPPTESAVLRQLKGILSRQEKEKEKHPEIHYPLPEQMRADCLKNYLKVYEPALQTKCMPDSASTSTLVSDVVQIYMQLAEHLIYTDGKVSMAPPSCEEWPVDSLKKVRITIGNFSVHSIHKKVVLTIV